MYIRYPKNSGGGGSGDVVGPGSSTNNAVARWDGTTGKLLQNSVVIIGDTGDVSGVLALTMTGTLTLNTGLTGPLKATAGVVSAAAINLASAEVTGVLPVANGGTNSSAALSNNRIMVSSGSAIVEASAITGSRALESNGSGIPIASAVTSTELGYVSGVTSSIQTQLNSKQATLTIGDITGTNIGVSGGTGAIIGSGVVVSIPQSVATSATPTFAGMTLTGFSGVVKAAAGVLSASAIANADIASNAAIDFSKLAALTSGNILVGNGSNVAASVTMSGDIAISNTGVTSYAGTVPLNRGGTGQTTKAPAFDALSPMTTAGDLIYGGASGTGTRLPVGTNGYVLTVSGGNPVWAPGGGGGSTAVAIANTPSDYVSTCLAGEAISALQAVAIALNSGDYEVFLADSGSSSLELGFAGFSTVSASIGDPVEIFQYGYLDGFSGLITGEDYYVSLVGNISRVRGPNAVWAGKAFSTTVLFVDSSRSGERYNSPTKYFLRSHGMLSTVGAGSVTNGVQEFDMSSWAAGASDSNSKGLMHIGATFLNNLHYAVDGIASTSLTALMTRVYDLSSWANATGGNRIVAKASQGVGLLGGTLYFGKGSTTNDLVGVANTLDGNDGSSWTNAITTFGNSLTAPISFVESGYVHWCGGSNSGGTGQTVHDVWDGGSLSTQTVFPATVTAGTCGGASPTGGIGSYYNSTNSYKWDGASWSTALTVTYNQNSTNNINFIGAAAGQNIDTQTLYINGGCDGGSNCLTTSSVFDGVSWVGGVSSSNSVAGGQGGNL